MTYGFSPEELSTEVRGEGEAIVRRALDRAGLPAQTPAVIVEGDAAEALVAAADERKATLLVIGTHGRRGLRRLVLGSVAEGVVRRSDVPVLVVPAKRA
jgi:nucleotide-binding universal stress UspA family protein